MLPENFNLDDSASERKLNLFVNELLGVEKFSPDSDRLNKYFFKFKEKLKELGIPVVIFAGTNGKGEVSLLFEKYCLDNGLTPHLWNSPHIISVRERISHAGYPICASTLLHYFESHRELTKKLSYYEFLFYIFCHSTFEEIKKDKNKKHILLLEVGLGGRLDATNFFDSDLAILTSISRDHVEFLGNKLSGILTEKIAVSREGKDLVSAVEQSFLRPLIRQYCDKKDILLHDLWEGMLTTDLDFHERNQLCARYAFEIFHYHILEKHDAVKINVIDHVWARPLKVTYKQCQFILLGSHNLDGLRHLAMWSSKMNQEQNNSCSDHYFDEAWMSFSRNNIDELKQCLELIDESPCIASDIYLTSFNHPRATDWNTLMESANSVMSKIGTKVYFEQDITTLINKLSEYIEDTKRDGKRTQKRILLAGSYYFIGSFISILSHHSPHSLKFE